MYFTSNQQVIFILPSSITNHSRLQMNCLILLFSFVIIFSRNFYSNYCGTCHLYWFLSFLLSTDMLSFSHNFQIFVCQFSNDNIYCYGHSLIASLYLLLLPICKTAFVCFLPLSILVINTILNHLLFTVGLVLHACTLNEWHNSLFGLFFAVEYNVAGRVVYPFDTEVRMNVKIVSQQLITHIIDSKKIPSIISKTNVFLS